MRNILLSSVAAAAVATAAVTAGMAQRAESQGPPAASSQQHPGTSKAGSEQKGRAPAAQSQQMPDRGAPKGAQAPSERRTTGAGAQERRSQSAPKGDRLDAAPKQQPGQAEEPRAGRKGAQQERQKSGKETQKSAAPEMRRDTTGAARDAGDAQKSDRQPRTGASERKAKERSTTGQTPSDREMNRTGQGRPDRANQRGERSQDRAPGAGRQGQTGQSTTAPSGRSGDRAGSRPDTTRQDTSRQDRSTTSTSVNVRPEVQERFTRVIERQNIRSDVNISVSVGSPLPRSVRVYDVPREIVEISPEFRGRKYTVVRDEIVIIEPRTNKVVAVIPRSGRATTGTTTSVRQTASSRLQLAPEKRRLIRETVIREQSTPRCEDLTITVGESVPRTIRLGPFPEDIVREVPEIRSYRFCVQNDEVVLIDPTEYRIVEVIE
jgi:hypothetical protein